MLELEKKLEVSWDTYLIQPWMHFFFSLNGPTAGYNLPLRIKLWNGKQIDLGDFKQPKMTVRINGWHGLWLLLRPNLNSIGEAYMRQELDIEGKLEDIVDVGFKLVEQINPTESRFERYFRFFNHSRLFDQQSIQHHYDVSNDFYRLWLGEHMVI